MANRKFYNIELRVNAIVDVMWKEEVPNETAIIQQGDLQALKEESPCLLEINKQDVFIFLFYLFTV